MKYTRRRVIVNEITSVTQVDEQTLEITTDWLIDGLTEVGRRAAGKIKNNLTDVGKKLASRIGNMLNPVPAFVGG